MTVVSYQAGAKNLPTPEVGGKTAKWQGVDEMHGFLRRRVRAGEKGTTASGRNREEEEEGKVFGRFELLWSKLDVYFNLCNGI